MVNDNITGWIWGDISGEETASAVLWTELGILQDTAFQNVVREPLHKSPLEACIFTSIPCDLEAVMSKIHTLRNTVLGDG